MKESLKKNDLVTLSITDLGSSGEGIGKVDGFTLFVKDALIGDRIQAKKILRLWPTDGDFDPITLPGRSTMPSGQSLRRLSDSAVGL